MPIPYNERLPRGKRSGIFLFRLGPISGNTGGVIQPRSRNSEAGFVLVDTLTAVAVISLVLTVCLVTVKAAGASARSAQTATEARVLLTSLMETTPHSPGVYQGRRGTLAYQVTVTETVLSDVHLCHMEAAVVPLKKTRAYHLSGTRWCAPVAQ